jgi:uncharacterized protein with ParB-like and HNH nuclease domain
MAFQTPITVKEAVDNIHLNKYLLPAIQRELVWSTQQIERLFDSLMRGYPVGSFLFWHVEKHRSYNYQFYEFIRNYHERDSKHNPKANVSGGDDITAILDGQQRLTSLYIGLRGSYAYKERMKRWDNNAAFPIRRLHLNLLSKCSEEDDRDLEYDFRFLTDKEAKDRTEADSENNYWFKVDNILNIKEKYEINDYLIEHDLMGLAKEKSQFANRTLFKLYSVVYEDNVINYFLEKDEALDKVLNIFIRVNSGGTPLSYSDLLLSIASAQWQEKDAREEITGFVDEISQTIGEGFKFDKDFVLKTCLVLCDFSDIAFKVDNFGKANMLTIENRWDDITKAISLAITLVAAFGYNRDTLTSANALIPIAYYLIKKNSPSNFVQSSSHQTDREKIQKWLTHSLLKRAFSGQPDNVLRPIRQVIANTNGSFPLEEIVEEFRGKPKSLVFNNDEIQNLFFYRYGGAYTFSTLALLYPTLDFRNKFHQDHIFPKSFFTRNRLSRRGIPTEKLESYIDNFDYLANLQLLEGIPNIEKSNKDFKEWLYQTHPNEQDRKDYMKKHYIPDVELGLENFEEFITERKKLMAAKFEILLKL